MMESRSRLTLEALLYGLVVAFAAVLRLSANGLLPLNDAESAEALAAAPSGYDLLRNAGGAGDIPISPSYQLLTGALFVLFGPRDTIARVVPALAGTMLVGVPLLLRRRIGKSAALFASALLAISPTMVAVSRTAGGTSLGLLTIALALLLLAEAKDSERPSRYFFSAGLCAALAILSGPSAYHGLVSVLLGVLLLSALKMMPSLGLDSAARRGDVIQGFLLAFLSIVGLSYLAGVTPGALAGTFNAAAGWLSGWGRLGNLPGLTAVLFLPIYEPLVLMVGAVWAIASARTSMLRGIEVGAGVWALTSLILIFAYPARRPEDLAWVVLPLTLLAARGLERTTQRLAQSDALWPSVLLAGVLLFLGCFAYIQLSAKVHGATPYAGLDNPMLETALIMAPFLIAAMTTLVFGLGWSWTAAGEASMTAGVLILLALNISACWRVNYPTQEESVELWRPAAITPELAMLKRTVGSIALAETGREDMVDLVIRGEASPVLAWTFYATLLAPQLAEEGQLGGPIEIVREADLTDDMARRYTGQSFALRRDWGWAGALPSDFLGWWISRNAPTVPERWFLLVPGLVGSEEAPPQ